MKSDEKAIVHIESSIHSPDKTLPVRHLTLVWTQVPVYAKLLALCGRSI
jgi:hypothetical protein